MAAWERDRASPSIRHWPRVIAFLGFDPLGPGTSNGEQLATARRRLGMTQREFAARLGLDEGTVADLERGRRRVSRRVVRAVEQWLEESTRGPG